MTQVGTPLWAAPEVLRAEQYDESVDTYSFGVIISEVKSKEAPFADVPRKHKDGFNSKLYREIKAGKRRVKNLPEWGPEIHDLIDRCTRFKAEERPPFTEVAEILERLCVGEEENEEEEEEQGKQNGEIVAPAVEEETKVLVEDAGEQEDGLFAKFTPNMEMAREGLVKEEAGDAAGAAEVQAHEALSPAPATEAAAATLAKEDEEAKVIDVPTNLEVKDANLGEGQIAAAATLPAQEIVVDASVFSSLPAQGIVASLPARRVVLPRAASLVSMTAQPSPAQGIDASLPAQEIVGPRSASLVLPPRPDLVVAALAPTQQFVVPKISLGAQAQPVVVAAAAGAEGVGVGVEGGWAEGGGALQ